MYLPVTSGTSTSVMCERGWKCVVRGTKVNAKCFQPRQRTTTRRSAGRWNDETRGYGSLNRHCVRVISHNKILLYLSTPKHSSPFVSGVVSWFGAWLSWCKVIKLQLLVKMVEALVAMHKISKTELQLKHMYYFITIACSSDSRVSGFVARVCTAKCAWCQN